jgi:hypothetical protein
MIIGNNDAQLITRVALLAIRQVREAREILQKLNDLGNDRIVRGRFGEDATVLLNARAKLRKILG